MSEIRHLNFSDSKMNQCNRQLLLQNLSLIAPPPHILFVWSGFTNISTQIIPNRDI